MNAFEEQVTRHTAWLKVSVGRLLAHALFAIGIGVFGALLFVGKDGGTELVGFHGRMLTLGFGSGLVVVANLGAAGVGIRLLLDVFVRSRSIEECSSLIFDLMAFTVYITLGLIFIATSELLV